MRCSVIIPTRNAGEQIVSLLGALASQSVKPEEILVVDSQSDDGTQERARRAEGVRVVSIRRDDFNHGGTRDMALRMTRGDIAVFMTQDALPVEEDCLAHLLAPFEDTHVAVVGGRQIARPDARPFEKRVRAYNYPDADRKWDQSAVGRMGVRAFLISNVCAAYRRTAYEAVGGFDHPILTNEDMLITQKFLEAGYTAAYSAQAAVYHSHRLTWRQEYRRNYLIGRTLRRYEERFCHAREMGEGLALFRHVTGELMREGQIAEGMAFAANCAARLLGNRMGRLRETEIIRTEGIADEHGERGDSAGSV